MAVGPTPILHILNHYHTTVVLTKFDILTRPAELHHVTEVSNHMHTIQYLVHQQVKQNWLARQKVLCIRSLGDLQSSSQQQQFRRSPSTLSPYCQSQLRRGCRALWCGDHQVTMLHCTPCDDDPGKDSTSFIASVLHKQTCIQSYNYN